MDLISQRAASLFALQHLEPLQRESGSPYLQGLHPGVAGGTSLDLCGLSWAQTLHTEQPECPWQIIPVR